MPPAAPVRVAPHIRFLDWASLQTTLIWIYDGLVAPEGRTITRKERSVSTNCWLVRRGTARVVSAGSSATAHAGQWMLVTAEPRTWYFTDDAHILSVHFQATWPGGESIFPRKKTLVFDADQFPNLERKALPLLRLVKRYFPKARDYLPHIQCPMDVYFEFQRRLPPFLLEYIDTMLALGHKPQRLFGLDERVLKTVMDTDRFPLNQRFSDRELAKSVGLSTAQLTRLFVDAFDLTPRRYFQRRRLESACQALAHTDSSVKEIAFGLGFEYVPHFCNWFHRLKGCSPTQFRTGESGG